MTSPHPVTSAPAPGTPEWATTITASKVPPMITNPDGTFAGFGYLTAWETYQELKGNYTPEHSDYMQRIFALAHEREEPAIQRWVDSQQHPQHWEIHLQETWINPTLPYNALATPDARAHNTETGEDVILEVKSPITGGAQPGWIMQNVAQHIITGIPRAELVIFPFATDTITTHPTDLTTELVNKVARDIENFNNLLEANTPPPGGDYDIPEYRVDHLKALKKAAEDADKAYKAARADLTKTIADNHAKRAVANGERIATMIDGKFSAARVPDEYKAILTRDDLQKTVTKLDEAKLKTEFPWVYAAGLGDPYITLNRNI